MNPDSRSLPTIGNLHGLLDATKPLPTCFAGPPRGGCGKKVVQSHSIQRAKLKEIARNGMVYHWLPNPKKQIAGDEQELIDELVGISKASTFAGFCASHDKTLFSVIEDEQIQANSRSCILFGFRTLCRELYQKAWKRDFVDGLRQFDGGRDSHEQVRFQHWANQMQFLDELGYKDLEWQFTRYRDAVYSGDPGELKYYIAELDRVPEVQGAGAFAPFLDFQDNVLQDFMDTRSPLDVMCFTVTANCGRGIVLFSYYSSGRGACSRLVHSFDRLPDYQKGDALVRFLFEHVDNTYMQPMWWESLSVREKNHLRRRMMSGTDPRPDQVRLSLSDDGYRFVNWQISQVSHN